MYVEGESSERERERYHGWGWLDFDFDLGLSLVEELYVEYDVIGEVENARCHIRPGNSTS